MHGSESRRSKIIPVRHKKDTNILPLLLQTVHGGLIMSLTDTLGSLAVATKGQFMTGVSVDIGTSFVKPAGKLDEEFTAKAIVVGLGENT